jgi:hypothetical protein
MTATAGALDVHLAQWLDAEPEARLTELFVADAREPRQRALLAIAHELHAAVFHAPDPRVAAAKLGWWMDDLAQAAQHPLVRGLLDAGAPREVLGALREGTTPLLRLALCESFESLAQWLDPLAQAATAFAAASAAAGSRTSAVPTRAVAAARMLDGIRDWPRFARAERALVPLELLARHRVDRAAAAACAPLAADLAARLGETLAEVPPPALRGPDGARIARAAACARRMVRRPEAWIDGSLRVPRTTLVFALWRVGRRG